MNDNKDSPKEYGHIDDIVDYQGNIYNPGHYVGTGRVPPTVSAPGNATPLAVLYFFASVLFAALGFFPILFRRSRYGVWRLRDLK